MGGMGSALAFGLPIFQSQNQHIQSIDQSMQIRTGRCVCVRHPRSLIAVFNEFAHCYSSTIILVLLYHSCVCTYIHNMDALTVNERMSRHAHANSFLR